jgi:hypothetical protein
MVGCAAGLIEGAPLRPAVEMAHVVNDGANLLPIARLGTTERLYLRGADLAIVNSGACALLAQAERLECLEKLSREIAPRPPSAVSFSTWVADVQQAPFPSLISHRSIFWRVSWPIGIRLLGLWLVQQPQLERDLVIDNLVIAYFATHADHFEPFKITEGARCRRYRRRNGIGNRHA